MSEGFVDVIEERCNFDGDLELRIRPELLMFLEKLLHEYAPTIKVARCHHGKTISNERIVCIVPFRTLRIQPDATVRDEIGKLRQRQGKDFFQHAYVQEFTGWIPKKFSIRSQCLNTFFNLIMENVIEFNRVGRILFDRFEVLDAVWDICVNKGSFTKLFMQKVGMCFFIELH